MFFEIRGQITEIETFATGSPIRELPRLRKLYGKGRWTGIEKKEFKIKRFVD